MELRNSPNGEDTVSLGREELATAAEHALRKFVQRRQSSSLTSICAFIFFEELIRNIRLTGRACTPPLSRRDFRQMLVSRDGLEHADKSRESAVDDFADEIADFRPSTTLREIEYVTVFTGPTPRGSRRGKDRGDLVFEMTLTPARAGETATVVPQHALHVSRGRCFCCHHDEGTYDPSHRFCGRAECLSRSIRKEERDLYVTIFPETESTSHVEALPNLDHPYDFFAVRHIAANNELALPPPPQIDYPFREDHLGKLGFRLGRPVLYRLPQLEAASGFSEVHVLDFSTYVWTNTLKDPKAWAVVNAALDNPNIRHLVAYTAGNAGLSLAKMAYAVNRAFGDRRLRVYALLEEEVGPEIRATLHGWQTEIIDLPSDPDRPVISEATIWRQLSFALTGVSSAEPVEGAWHVSDGWDGVGVMMYRLLFAQVLRHCKIDYLIVPVGTGNLLLGAQLGIRDASVNHIRTIAALPAGKNILENCRLMKIPRVPESLGVRGGPAQAPKLVGRYTPLMPCIAKLIDDGDIDAVEVSRERQVKTAKWLWQHRESILDVAAEPSALVAFGALLTAGPDSFQQIVRTRERTLAMPEFSSNARVLVVNTGSGVISAADATFLNSARAGLRGDEMISS